MDEQKFENEWCLIEMMGHRRVAGRVTSVTVAGHGMLRVDVECQVDADAGASTIATQFISPGSLYAITPMTEDMCRRFTAANRPTPVSRWELAAPVEHRASDDEDDDCDALY